MAKDKSVEANIEDEFNNYLRAYNLDYRLKNQSLNSFIDEALAKYPSKTAGTGGNFPDAKLLLKDKYDHFYPVMIEYKGHKDKLIKLNAKNEVENLKADKTPNYKNINSYALNGAVHYANAIIDNTSYKDIIAIGVTGYKDSFKNLQHEIAVYYVSDYNLGLGQKIDDYTDLSFLKRENFDDFITKIDNLKKDEKEIQRLKLLEEQELEASLVKLNNHIYKEESTLSERDRVYLVCSVIMATIGIRDKKDKYSYILAPLKLEDLKSLDGSLSDGNIILAKIKDFLKQKQIPEDKRELIIRTLSNTLLAEYINKAKNGESQIKKVFRKTKEDLGRYYDKRELNTDFTGKLFNEMYNWLGFTQDKLNDVVLTPSYVATLLVKLSRVDMNSYVWDFATGSAGLLVAAMNEMIANARASIKSPQELALKKAHIKANQLLGLEVLQEIYMLAILNMILMGDGSSNILNKDSLEDFTGFYGFGKVNDKFPASAFVLNPPYGIKDGGNGMIFVQKALSMMNKGYASIIIQSSAGSGKAKEFNIQILKTNTLIASIKMPIDLFVGKSSVQTHIYVFKVGEAHHKDDIVKFIDFSDDGYTRSNRKKASVNLRDTSNAKEKYEEIVNLVRFGKSKFKYLKEQNYYESTIDPLNGADWNQAYPVDTKPTLEDFKKTVSDYLSWEVANILKNSAKENPKLEK